MCESDQTQHNIAHANTSGSHEENEKNHSVEKTLGLRVVKDLCLSFRMEHPQSMFFDVPVLNTSKDCASVVKWLKGAVVVLQWLYVIVTHGRTKIIDLEI
ncbi:hypothetical protein QE152_g35158 [Popillia japonica]|uniref:Uncharacterized protein n=1 Tax=Popillia japonica TaxID=7064 RepID=A0AAW1ISA0_POPJA